MSKLLRDRTITLDPGAKFVLMTIADVTPKGTTTCYVGQETIAKRTGMGERTVRRHIDELVDLGLLKRTRRHTRKGWRDLDGFEIGPPEPTGQIGRLDDAVNASPVTCSTKPTGQKRQSLPAKNDQTLPANLAGQDFEQLRNGKNETSKGGS